MKKLLLLSVLMTGCAVTYEQPIITPVNPTYAEPLRTALSQSQTQASQLNQFMQGLYGPNNVSQALLNYQNANRQLQYFLSSPFEFVIVNRQWTKMQ